MLDVMAASSSPCRNLGQAPAWLSGFQNGCADVRFSAAQHNLLQDGMSSYGPCPVQHDGNRVKWLAGCCNRKGADLLSVCAELLPVSETRFRQDLVEAYVLKGKGHHPVDLILACAVHQPVAEILQAGRYRIFCLSLKFLHVCQAASASSLMLGIKRMQARA